MIAAIAAAVLAIPVGWLAVREARVMLLSGTDPVAALEAKPASPQALDALASQMLRTLPDEPAIAMDMARQAAGHAPLLATPFAAGSLVAALRGDAPAERRLAEEAVRRDPLEVGHRLRLVEVYDAARDYGPLVRQIDALMRLEPSSRRAMVPALVPLVAQPDARAALAEVLAKGGEWRRDFFEVVTRQDVQPAAVHDLVHRIERNGVNPLTTREVEALLSAFVARGLYREAHLLFLNRLRARGQAHDGLVFNPEFQPPIAARPFEWTLSDGAFGGAEIVQRSDGRPLLAVRYVGGDSATFARQTLALAPGSYRLVARGTVDGAAAGEWLRWSVACARSGERLVRAPAAMPAASDGSWSGRFTVPANCAGQTLSLEAEPPGGSAVLTATLDSVRILPADGARP